MRNLFHTTAVYSTVDNHLVWISRVEIELLSVIIVGDVVQALVAFQILTAIVCDK